MVDVNYNGVIDGCPIAVGHDEDLIVNNIHAHNPKETEKEKLQDAMEAFNTNSKDEAIAKRNELIEWARKEMARRAQT